MEKMRMESVDITARNIEKIGELFPNCITEMLDEEKSTPEKKVYKKAVNFELLKQMLSGDVIDGDEAYEFTWVGKKAAIVEANKPIRKTLRPCKEESVNWDTTENLYIEGDNLEVLKLLQESYLGKVKMIYIDPPYNTGHDFIYPDSFIMDNEDYNDGTSYFDEEGNVNFARENSDSAGKYHSDWCSMIYARLVLARNLLTEDGFIAISIGEEESYNLRKICNEVFGETNFRNTLAVRRYDKNLNLQFADKGLFTMNVGLEYVLIYSKNTSARMKAVYKSSTDERSQLGYWKGFWNNADRPTMRYNVLGVTPDEGQWKWKKEVADEAVENYIEYEEKYASKMTLEEYWIMTGKCKRFLRRKTGGTGKNQGIEHWVAPAAGILRNSNWSDYLVSKPAGMDIKFDSPKNPDFVAELVELFDIGDGDSVLDFFSGSASTAHAVIQKNADDQLRRRFVMVQLEQTCSPKSDAYKDGFMTICEIGKERIRRAARKIHEENPEAKFDDGFRVFKLDDTNMNNVYYSPADYSQGFLSQLESNIKSDRTDLDLLFGCLLEWGLPLSLPYSLEQIEGCAIHNYNDGDLIACFDENIPDSVIKEIAMKQPLRAVFRDSSFASSPSKINVGEIFKLIAPDTRVKVI
ncbi:MAG: site-specific DNA-methyltransferase [Lachnospiraceae bacterium]|nr:site-specific DNA-methyltransferase [Lachnospiraceae bacterium]